MFFSHKLLLWSVFSLAPGSDDENDTDKEWVASFLLLTYQYCVKFQVVNKNTWSWFDHNKFSNWNCSKYNKKKKKPPKILIYFEVGRGTYIIQSIAGTGIYTICKQNTCKFRLRELEKNLTKIFEIFVFQWIDSRHLWFKWWRWRIWGESLKNNRENIMFIDCFR